MDYHLYVEFAYRSSNYNQKGDGMENSHNILLDRKSAAKYLRISPGTLAVWDCTKRYDLKPLKVGRSVRYRKSDLDNFVERQLTK